MIRKAYIIGTVAVVLTAGALGQSPMYSRLMISARSFRQNFCELQRNANSLGLLERVVFSLSVDRAAIPSDRS